MQRLSHVRLSTLICIVGGTLLAGRFDHGMAQDIPYGVGSWLPSFGSHRARIQVSEKADAVWVHIPWRRRDLDPQNKNIVVVDATTGREVKNVARVEVNREFGEIVFQPDTAPGEFFVYYMPYTADTLQWAYATHYTPPQSTADPAWLGKHGLTPQQIPEGRWKSLPQAKVLEFQARTEFDRFDPMEVIATAGETKQLVAQNPDRSYLVFPEDRKFPIRMTDDLPLRWIRNGPNDQFHGEALRGEFYVFQIGVYAARKPVESLAVHFTDLRSKQGKAISADTFHCFNTGGIDWLDRPLKKSFTVPLGKAGALWCGVQIPKAVEPGEYEGTLTLQPKGSGKSILRISLTVADRVIDECGDAELWRQSRLRWLDSTIGLDDEVVAPYTPLKVESDTVKCLGRQVRFASTGLPESIRSNSVSSRGQRELLARPVAVVVETSDGEVTWKTGKTKTLNLSRGAVVRESTGASGLFTQRCRAKMEFDGYINFRVTLKAAQATEVKDVRLEAPIKREVATYMMGLGRKGGYRPKEWSWKWDPARANNMVWMGDVDAGLQFKLKNNDETWDIWNLTEGVPESWGNGGKGGCTVTEEGSDAVLIRAYTGPRAFKAGEELELRFALLITPVKPLDPLHWKQRYYHIGPSPIDAVLKCGANIINIHHGNELNPYINYPFLSVDKLAGYAQQAHEKGVKVKIYYTVRELSNRVAEMWALRSLGNEVFVDGGEGGHSWLREHLVSHYAPAWHQPYPNGDVDAAIATTGLSRWHNYYLEGLAYLLRHAKIDGLYLDGIGYDREIMKRVRKVMDRERPGCLIDFHSGNEFTYADGRISPANKYMEHLPYINSLWFGEGYDYNETPDYWLVEVSGIPFGLYGEMLEGNGNPWRGMIYGMTARYYSGADPKHIWELWDDFGIQDAQMIGYWSASCPVKTDQRDVLATVYRKKDKTLVSLASWAKETVRCKLKIDWNSLRLAPEKTHLFAPGISGFQSAALFEPSDEIPITPGRGWLLLLDEKKHDAPTPVDVYKGRPLLLDEHFASERLGESWKVQLSNQPDTSLKVEGGALAITTCANCCAFAERPLPAGTALVDCLVYSGSDKGASWGPGLAVVWPNKVVRINLRAEGRYGVDDGANQAFGGLVSPNSWYHLRVRLEEKEILAEASGDGLLWETIYSLPRADFPGDPVALLLGKMSPGAKNEDYSVLGPVGTCAIKNLRVFGKRQ